MVIGGFDITDKYIRARQVEPGEFEKGSLRTIRLAPGIKAIVGKKSGASSTTIQSILFDKKKFTEDKAKEWLHKHKEKFSQALDLESKKMELFSDGSVPLAADVLTREEALTLMELMHKLLASLQEEEDSESEDSTDVEDETTNSSPLVSNLFRVV